MSDDQMISSKITIDSLSYINISCTMKSDNTIKFYYEYQPYGFMSNFYPSPFVVGENTYKTNEHYFQSKKYEGRPQQQLVINSPTPMDAFKLGRSQDITTRSDWQQVKQKIMYEGLRHKFTTHKDLYQQLMQTGQCKLIEHTKNDRYWADGGDGNGRNRLGVLLMRLREQFRKSQ